MLSAIAIFVLALTIFAALLVWAAVSDFRRYLIPNQASLGALALYPVAVLSAPEPLAWVFALIMAAVFFAVGFAMYLLRAMGAGDAKLLPVVVLWVGPKDFALFLLVLLGSAFVLAGVVGLGTALAEVRAGEKAAGAGGAAAIELSGIARMKRVLGEIRHVPFLKIQVPYGVAIAAGGITVAVNALFTTLR
jgi:prepilin peptidase CpaA